MALIECSNWRGRRTVVVVHVLKLGGRFGGRLDWWFVEEGDALDIGALGEQDTEAGDDLDGAVGSNPPRLLDEERAVFGGVGVVRQHAHEAAVALELNLDELVIAGLALEDVVPDGTPRGPLGDLEFSEDPVAVVVQRTRRPAGRRRE
jgi:hypothetical protein